MPFGTLPIIRQLPLKQQIETTILQDKTIQQALIRVLREAQRLREDSDNENKKTKKYKDDLANLIQRSVHSYVDGWNKICPFWLQDYIKEIENESDPEFGEYLRLREKFEGIKQQEEKDFSHLPHHYKGDLSKEFA